MQYISIIILVAFSIFGIIKAIDENSFLGAVTFLALVLVLIVAFFVAISHDKIDKKFKK